jgi:large subunit ribosomal protein L5
MAKKSDETAGGAAGAAGAAGEKPGKSPKPAGGGEQPQKAAAGGGDQPQKAQKAAGSGDKAQKAAGGGEKGQKAGKAPAGGGKPGQAAAPAGGAPQAPRPKEKDGYAPRLKQRYHQEVVPKLKQEFGIKNNMAVPRLEKIALNMGVGEAIQNIKILDDAVEEMAALAGQRPVVTRAQKSIAAFKLREGMPIGCRVTLRGERMWEFLDRFITVALPRVRDFRGVSPKSFDGRGNYTVAVRDHLIFPEVDYNKVERSKGMNITIVTTAGNDERAQFLLRELGMPFQR